MFHALGPATVVQVEARDIGLSETPKATRQVGTQTARRTRADITRTPVFAPSLAQKKSTPVGLFPAGVV
jgi:hypothetical protein